MRWLFILCFSLVGCAKPEPVQDPLEYLRIGIDPRVAGLVVLQDLEREGYEVGSRIDESRYFAFDAARGPDSTVRIFTERGPALSLQTPDVRALQRVRVSLVSDSRPDFDRDEQPDIVVAIDQIDRTCLAWMQVDRQGFVSAVFRPRPEWGGAPCVIAIDATWPRVLLEVSVPDAAHPNARVRIPIQARVQDWVVDHSPSAESRWEHEIRQREASLAAAGADPSEIERIRTELAWIKDLRGVQEQPDAGVPETEGVLEAAEDGEEAR